MATFWGAQPLKDGEGTTPFRGTYHRHAYGIGEHAFPLALPFPPQGTARGKMAVSLHASGLCYSVRETAPVGGVSARVLGHRRQYEGAGIMMGAGLYIVLRDCLTRRPKSLALSPRSDVPDSGVILEGTADEPEFGKDSRSRVPTVRLQYLKQDQEP